MDAYDYDTVAERVILVTGAGRGLGAAICDLLGAEGAQMVVTDIDEVSAKAVASAIEANGGRACAFRLDVGDEDDVRQVLDQAMQKCGRLDAIINNAGIDITIGIQELDYADWEKVMRTNLSGPFLLSKFGLAHLAPGGHIV